MCGVGAHVSPRQWGSQPRPLPSFLQQPSRAWGEPNWEAAVQGWGQAGAGMSSVPRCQGDGSCPSAQLLGSLAHHRAAGLLTRGSAGSEESSEHAPQGGSGVFLGGVEDSWRRFPYC